MDQVNEFIEVFEKAQENGTAEKGTYAKWRVRNHHVPKSTLLINGEMVEFMVDSGATDSVIARNSLRICPSLSGKAAHSITASGLTVREPYTVPLKCQDDHLGIFKHSFLYSDHCPVNLMGRDLMAILGICLVPHNGRIVLRRLNDLKIDSGSACFVKYSPLSPLYVYQWKLDSNQCSQVNEHLVKLAKEHVTPDRNVFMHPSDLHVTAHVHEGPDLDFEQKWENPRSSMKSSISHPCIGPQIDVVFTLTFLSPNKAVTLSRG